MDTTPSSSRRSSSASLPVESPQARPTPGTRRIAWADPTDAGGTTQITRAARDLVPPARETAAPTHAPQDAACHTRVLGRLRQWRTHLGQARIAQARIGLPLLSAGAKLGIAIGARGHLPLCTAASTAALGSLTQAGIGHLAGPAASDGARLRHTPPQAAPARDALAQSLAREQKWTPLLGGLMALLIPAADALVIASAFEYTGQDGAPAPCEIITATVFVILASALLDMLAARDLAYPRSPDDAAPQHAPPQQAPLPHAAPLNPQAGTATAASTASNTAASSARSTVHVIEPSSTAVTPLQLGISEGKYRDGKHADRPPSPVSVIDIHRVVIRDGAAQPALSAPTRRVSNSAPREDDFLRQPD